MQTEAPHHWRQLLGRTPWLAQRAPLVRAERLAETRTLTFALFSSLLLFCARRFCRTHAESAARDLRACTALTGKGRHPSKAVISRSLWTWPGNFKAAERVYNFRRTRR